MKRTRITEEEIKSALREHGITKNDGANWVVLETNGNLSVVPRQEIKWEEAETLSDVRAPNRMPGR
jgi:uncharacterized membrane protein YcaP (DUF421 family)